MGFWSSAPVHTALWVGLLVGVVCGPVGVFTVMRGQSFAGHSLSDIGTTGGAGAYLLGVNVLYGFVAFNVLAATAMEAAGVQRARSRDVTTGIVLGASLGLTALFLHWQTSSSTTGATMTVLFGSIFTFQKSTLPLVAGLSLATLALIALLYRPLLLASVSSEIAAARGVPVKLVGAAYLVALSLAVSLSAISIGAILSTALLIGPAATALRLTRRPGAAVVVAAAVGVAVTWLGIALSYLSYDWPPDHRGWPVSFFVVAMVLTAYFLSLLVPAERARRTV